MSVKRVKGNFAKDMKKKQEAFKRLQHSLPKILGNDTENHFKEGFRRGGGMTDAGSWKPRKRSDFGRAILVQSGTLRRDIKRRQTSWGRTVVSTSQLTEDYAAVHNRGLRAGRGRGFQMPKREFIGESRILRNRLKISIQKELKRL